MSQSSRPILRVFWRHARRYPWLLAGIMASILFLNICDVIIPTLYKRLIDVAASGIPQHEMAAGLMGVFVSIIALNAVKWATFRGAALSNNAFQPRVMADLERTAFGYLLDHSYRFFSNAFGGALARKVHRLSRAFEVFSDQIVWRLTNVILTTTGMMLVFWWRAPILAIILAAWVIIFVIINVLFSRWKLRYDEQRAALDSEATGVLSDALSNAIVIKQYTGGAHERALFHAVTERLRRMHTFTWNLAEINNAVQFLLMMVLEISVIVIAIRLYANGALTIGDFVLIQTALTFIFDRLWDFGQVLRHIYEALADAREMVDVLEMPHEVIDRKGAKKLRVGKGEIVFQDVTFAYSDSRTILSHFSLTIAPHEKVAFVGPSGAGKSTITKLMLRFFDVTKGNILIDGQPITKVTQDSLREQVALVPQDPILFHRSLMDNIRYGRRDATDEEVIAAAKKAHCDEFIRLLPKGYDTLVGERGVKLSGGERQRVAIARAILKNAPILILDEATSSLDSASEALIQDALHQLMRDKTVIVIAHRLSTIMLMDRIVVIEKGTVADTGTHTALLQREGTYKKLWSIQAGGFLP